MAEVRPFSSIRAAREHDNSMHTPVDCLRDTIADIEAGEITPSSVLVLGLDRGQDGESFRITWAAANLRSSEMLAVLEAAKARILAEMGYV